MKVSRTIFTFLLGAIAAYASMGALGIAKFWAIVVICLFILSLVASYFRKESESKVDKPDAEKGGKAA